MVYGMPLAMANFAGEQNGAVFWGGSRVLDPYGNNLAQAGDGEDMIFAELDFQAVLTARYHLPTLRDSTLDLTYREPGRRSEEHTTELPSLMRRTYAVCSSK